MQLFSQSFLCFALHDQKVSSVFGALAGLPGLPTSSTAAYHPRGSETARREDAGALKPLYRCPWFRSLIISTTSQLHAEVKMFMQTTNFISRPDVPDVPCLGFCLRGKPAGRPTSSGLPSQAVGTPIVRQSQEEASRQRRLAASRGNAFKTA